MTTHTLIVPALEDPDKARAVAAAMDARDAADLTCYEVLADLLSCFSPRQLENVLINLHDTIADEDERAEIKENVAEVYQLVQQVQVGRSKDRPINDLTFQCYQKLRYLIEELDGESWLGQRLIRNESCRSEEARQLVIRCRQALQEREDKNNQFMLRMAGR